MTEIGTKKEQAKDEQASDKQAIDRALDTALDDAVENSMDASDPPAITRPSDTHEPAPSSGYDAEEESRRKDR